MNILFKLVVVSGPDAGKSLPLGQAPRTIGRSEESDLPLHDASVSRRHLEVTATPHGVRIGICKHAESVVVDGIEVRNVVLTAGRRFMVGTTVILVLPGLPTPPSSVEAALRTQPRERVDDAESTPVFALCDALDSAVNVDEVLKALASWAKRSAGTVALRVHFASDLDVAALTALLHGPPTPRWRASTRGRTGTLTVPTRARELVWFAFTLDSPEEPSLVTQEMLAVGARLAATTLARVRSIRHLEGRIKDLILRVDGSAQTFHGDSPASRTVRQAIQRMASTSSCVLVQGESGAGTSFVARLVHEASSRAHEPLRTVDCAAIPEGLIESELFGHARRAVPGAVSSRRGVFEEAGSGTVVLVEIGALPLTTQATLAQVFGRRRVERIGGGRPIAVNARILVTTRHDLRRWVSEGRFDKDLFDHISGLVLDVPPLRDRGNDVIALARQILQDTRPGRRHVLGFTPAVLNAFRTYPWPGNVLQLRNAIEHAVLMGQGSRIDVCDLPREFLEDKQTPIAGDRTLVRLPAPVAWLEQRNMDAALRATGDNSKLAAALLGVNRSTLWRRVMSRVESDQSVR